MNDYEAMLIDWVKLAEEMKKDPERKQQVDALVAKFARSRLSYNQRNELSEAKHD